MLRPLYHTEQPKWLFLLRHIILYYTAPLLLIYVPFFLVLIIFFLGNTRETPDLRYAGLGSTPEALATPFDPEAIFWFLQISDTHFSDTEPDIYRDFDLFLKNRVNSGISPEFVLHSGDITDGFERGRQVYPFFVSKQYIEQWIRYKAILQDNELWDPTLWIEVRGNHDCYSVPSIFHPLNYFITYSSVSRRWGPRQFEWSYSYNYKRPYGSYSFVLFDACPQIGVNFPLNFFGSSHEESEAALRQELKEAQSSNVSFFISHYPINDMRFTQGFFDLITPNKLLDGVNPESDHTPIPIAALNGHLHAVDTYRRVTDDFVELQVADFKNQRYYRIISLDNDFFSFKDVQFQQNDWPLIHITNPKKASVLTSQDDWKKLKTIPFIRALVFSDSAISGTNLKVYIDGDLVANEMSPVELSRYERRFNSSNPGGLFSTSFDPSKYEEGLHTLRIDLVSGEEILATDTAQFSLDGKTALLGSWYGSLTLDVEDYEVCRAIVSFFYAYAVLILLLIPKFFVLSLTVLGLYPRFRSYMDGYLARATELIPVRVTPPDSDPSPKKRLGAGRSCLYIGLDLIHSIGYHIMQYGRIHIFLWLIHCLFAFYFVLGPIVVGPVVVETWAFLFFAGVSIEDEFSFLPETVCYYGFFIVILIWMPSILVSSVPYNPRVTCDKIQKKVGLLEDEGFFLHLLRTLYRFTLLGVLAAVCSFVFCIIMSVFLAWQYGFGVLSSISTFWFTFFTVFNTAIAFIRVWKLRPTKMVSVVKRR